MKFDEELLTKKKKLIHAEALTKQPMTPTRGPQPLWASGGSLTDTAPSVVRTWPARGGGKKISNLVSSSRRRGAKCSGVGVGNN
ncbi:hypothetical protein DPMN_048726 [Dreissena polymorpha]|uniref:Uncharacterized protein n=1 Tax=Dreissena polymorpha TaxID=45954 RepID=A0A9D4DCW8_DREPO|nr:hypothetical protein DPMN_048726 [Dreissena polymorpha]